MITTSQLRERFLAFFRDRGHTIVPSSPLVPGNDPTLLFTNAGMVQFKDTFLGRDPRPYLRAASSQRCVRAGGKHNDLENVGYTARHHTFFEMLGNFSFGEYFKREAIQYAWEFLIKDLRLSPERLWVTVYEEDREAEKIWLSEIGVDPKRFSRIGARDNFWAMGDTGPCGPCSEIFYDHGPRIAGGPPGSAEADGDRYVEIWNLVFMQFDRAADGKLTPLPRPSVDTGMGLERIAAVMQGVHSNYDIDLFRRLIQAAAETTGSHDLKSPSLRVIADHIRACGFLITDGVLPGNEGRGYVLRRILRRAIRHGYKLGQSQPFFHRLVAPLVAEMGEAYPELKAAQLHVEKVIRQEEERFAETLDKGMRILEEAVAKLSGKVIPGDVVFKLYDTYGFPVDLTADIARERGLELDLPGFEQAMEGQREQARAASKFEGDYGQGLQLEVHTEFTGYDRLSDEGRVAAILKDGRHVETLDAGDSGMVVLDRTPFYAESGGQVGDTGHLRGEGVDFEVRDTQSVGGAIAHVGTVKSGSIEVGDTLKAEVASSLRRATMRNHSATHLLHAALRQVLGTHVTQKGSLVEPGRLRFDFSHYEAVKPEQLAEIEALVNRQILGNIPAEVTLTSYDQAIAAGAMALFGEKYGEQVRMLKFGDFSTELCGGTHVARTGDIGLFKIVSESGIASGVRRIEAVSGEGALAYVADTERKLRCIAERVKAGRDDVDDKVAQLAERVRQLEKQLAQLQSKAAAQAGGELAAQAQDLGGVKLLAARLDGADGKSLRETLDQLKNKLGSAVVVLGSASADGKVSLIAGVTADQTARVKAGELVNFVAQQVGGKGGGRPDMAQAGGTQPDKLDAALASVRDWVAGRL
ncbi:MAG TPA: alanine--tRNA ligase [Nevskiales bacterium]|nr:alanine--tRNA ligase [Nevskiales bacterium]